MDLRILSSDAFVDSEVELVEAMLPWICDARDQMKLERQCLRRNQIIPEINLEGHDSCEA